jgi:hypothetical protein
MEVGGVPLLECSPPTGGTEERLRSEGMPVSDRGRSLITDY